MNNQILERILITTYTIGSYRKRVKALKSRVSSRLFGSSTNTFLEQEEQEWLNSAGIDLLQQINSDNFDEVFSQLDSFSNNTKALTVYLAFDPSDMQITQIGSFVRDSISPDLIMDIKLDKELIGGCAFIWNGIYRDFSLRAQIQDKKEEIMNLFRGYLNAK